MYQLGVSSLLSLVLKYFQLRSILTSEIFSLTSLVVFKVCPGRRPIRIRLVPASRLLRPEKLPPVSDLDSLTPLGRSELSSEILIKCLGRHFDGKKVEVEMMSYCFYGMEVSD